MSFGMPRCAAVQCTLTNSIQVNTLFFEITTEQTAQVRWPYCALAHSTRCDSPAPRLTFRPAVQPAECPIRSGRIESLRLLAFGGKG